MKNKFVILIIGGISVFVIFIFVVFGAFFLLFNFGMKQNSELRKKQSAEAVGTIAWVNQSHTGPHDTLESKYDYIYIVNGVSYNKQETSPGIPSDKDRKGLKVKVCYDPTDPNSSSIHFEVNAVCGE